MKCKKDIVDGLSIGFGIVIIFTAVVSLLI